MVLTINDDRNIHKIGKAAEKLGTSLPILHDKGSATVDAYHAFALPTLCLMDKEHVVRQVWAGSMKERTDELVERINSVLESGSISNESEAPAESKEIG